MPFLQASLCGIGCAEQDALYGAVCPVGQIGDRSAPQDADPDLVVIAEVGAGADDVAVRTVFADRLKKIFDATYE